MPSPSSLLRLGLGLVVEGREELEDEAEVTAKAKMLEHLDGARLVPRVVLPQVSEHLDLDEGLPRVTAGRWGGAVSMWAER